MGFSERPLPLGWLNMANLSFSDIFLIDNGHLAHTSLFLQSLMYIMYSERMAQKYSRIKACYCQRFDVLFLFGLVWQYSSVQKKYNKGRFKFMATHLQQ